MQVVGLSRLWMLAALLGTKASCMEEEGAMVKKKAKGQKHVSCSLPVWEFALGGGPGKF